MMRNMFRWVMATVVLASAGAFFLTSAASAACPAACDYPFSGRDYYRGYFTNASVPINSADPSTHGAFWQAAEAPWTVSDANALISFMGNSMFDNSNGSINNHTGAAGYIVTAMLGYRGPDFGGSFSNGVNTARSRWTDWQQLVRDYDSAGLIRWNDTFTECPGDVQANLDYINHDSYYYPNFFVGSCYTDPVITFLHPTTRAPIFRLKKSCGNPVGNNQALPPVTPPPYGTVNPPTPGNGSTTPPTPSGYNTGNTSTNSSCAFTTGTAHDPSDANYQVPITVTYSGGGTGTSTGTSSASSPYAYTVATPQSVKNSISTVTATVIGRARNGTNFNIGTINFGPCLLANPTCPTPTVAPSSIDPQTRFTVSTAVNYGTPLEAQTTRSQPDFRYFITISGPGFSYNNQNVPVAGPGGSVTISANTGQIGPTNNAGIYAIGWGIVSSFGAVNCGAAIPANPNPPTFPVANKPYFKVNGGDISAGAGMSTGGLDCASGGVAPNPNASIVSWNRGNTGAYGGAGTQFGALALNHLMGFASGQGSGFAPSRLSFGNTGAANQVNEPQELYGGKFGSTACTADYFANATSIQTGNITIGGQTVANGTRQTIYVDGNVYITGNIVFAGATAGYPNTAAIPSFSIIVRGNIYIAPGVTQLDGFYVAQPSNGTATNGIIYSCAPSGFGTNSANVLTATLQNNCSQALTVNGAFAARQVWLLRTAGTVSGNTAAETFNYSPDVWLSAPFDNGLSPVTNDEYDAITSLPPVL